MTNTLQIKNTGDLLDLVHDGTWVQAVMRFPNDKYLRESWYATEVAKSNLHDLGDDHPITMDKRTIDALINSPSFSDLKNLSVDAIKQGVVAGDVLASIYIMHIFNMKEPSVNKAIHISRRYNDSTTYGDKSRISRSESSIKKYRKKFESVAHLWAAFRLNQSYPFACQEELFLEKLPLFLEVSAGILEFGCNFVPYRARPPKPIFDASKMWLVPGSFKPRNLVKGEFPEGIKEWLEDYDADEYHY